MSKGSARRPGSGYADGWECIFKKDARVLLNRAKQSEQEAKNREARTLLDAMPVANECQPAGVYAIKVGQGVTITLPQQTCGECKYFDYVHDAFLGCGECKGPPHHFTDEWAGFCPTPDFGCNKWERKV